MRNFGRIPRRSFLAGAVSPLCWTAPRAAIWHDLAAGPHTPGFRNWFEFDRSRADPPPPRDPDRCLASLRGPVPDRRACEPAQARRQQDGPRPILVALWYPARSLGFEMTLADYLRLPALRSAPDFPSRLSRFSLTAFERALSGATGMHGHRDRKNFKSLLAVRTGVRRDAPAAPGRFPVVIYHPGAGGSYDENALLAGFLASHGYVVISSAYQTSTACVTNAFDQTPRSILDMQFLLEAVNRLPFADSRRIAAIGHSAGAQTILQWLAAPDCPVRAAVSLDSTVEYTPHGFPGHQPLLDFLAAGEPPVVPVLLAASGDRHPAFSRWDFFFRRAERYEVTVGSLRHDGYVSQGALRSILHPQDRDWEAYSRICTTVRLFLDAVLAGVPEARFALERLERAEPSSGLALRYRPARN